MQQIPPPYNPDWEKQRLEARQEMANNISVTLVILALIGSILVCNVRGNQLYYADQQRKVEAGLMQCYTPRHETIWTKPDACEVLDARREGRVIPPTTDLN